MAAFQAVFFQLENGLKKDGFHISRFQILFVLYFEGGLSAADLARRLVVTRGNISTFLKRLERDGHIRVCPMSPSMSRPHYRLTLKAERLFEKTFPIHVERIIRFVPKLKENTLKELRGMEELRTTRRTTSTKKG